MKRAMALLLTTLAPFLRDTNSHAAAERGREAFANRDYAAAVSSFRTANAIAPSPERDFDLGTAQVAAGLREDGSATLGRAMRDPRLRQAALYNRGNAALAASAYDRAIRDYIEALRLEPRDAAAKRNLEIALRRRAQEDEQKGPKGTPPSSGPPAPQPQTSQSGQRPKGEADVEALLRSVQQQEQEEIARMRGQKPARGHVGW
jgi:tetratricopeptide (TPR) repeat protein